MKYTREMFNIKWVDIYCGLYYFDGRAYPSWILKLENDKIIYYQEENFIHEIKSIFHEENFYPCIS